MARTSRLDFGQSLLISAYAIANNAIAYLGKDKKAYPMHVLRNRDFFNAIAKSEIKIKQAGATPR